MKRRSCGAVQPVERSWPLPLTGSVRWPLAWPFARDGGAGRAWSAQAADEPIRLEPRSPASRRGRHRAARWAARPAARWRRPAWNGADPRRALDRRRLGARARRGASAGAPIGWPPGRVDAVPGAVGAAARCRARWVVAVPATLVGSAVVASTHRAGRPGRASRACGSATGRRRGSVGIGSQVMGGPLGYGTAIDDTAGARGARLAVSPRRRTARAAPR